MSLIFSPTATDTPGEDATQTNLFKQLIKPGPLSIQCTVLGHVHTGIMNQGALERFLERMNDKGKYGGLFTKVRIQQLYLRPVLSEVNYLIWPTNHFLLSNEFLLLPSPGLLHLMHQHVC